MSDRKRQTIAISGNNAISLERSYYEKENEQPKNEIRRKSNRNLNAKIKPIYTFSLALIIMSTLVVAVILLKAQFVVSDNAEKIIALQQNLLEIKKQNNQLENDIEKGINMEEVYRIATNELGMVQANKENIQYIGAKELSYTVQYADVDVREEKENLSISNILGFISKGW